MDPLPDDYLAVCADHSEGEADLSVWAGLAEMLAARPGWHWSDPRDEGYSGPPVWCFGLAGACRLALTPVDGRFLLYVHERDEELPFDEAADVARWLAEHESDFEGFTDLQRELLGDLLPGQVDRWSREDGRGAE